MYHHVCANGSASYSPFVGILYLITSSKTVRFIAFV